MILTEEEREYLRAVIKPFRDRDIEIKKWDHSISYNPKTRRVETLLFIHRIKGFSGRRKKYASFDFFRWTKGERFKGMETDRYYTLEELEL